MTLQILDDYGQWIDVTTKRLTEMQMRFAFEHYVYGDENGPMTKTEAAIKTYFYSPKRARQEGSELTNPKLSPLVVKYMGELREERLKNTR